VEDQGCHTGVSQTAQIIVGQDLADPYLHDGGIPADDRLTHLDAVPQAVAGQATNLPRGQGW
jgi:hypothetical protein